MRRLSIILISLLTFMAQSVSASSEGEIDVAEIIFGHMDGISQNGTADI